MQEQFNRQREEILSHLDASRIGTKSGSVTYSKKDYLDDLADWQALAVELAKAVEPILFNLLSETGRDAMAEIGAYGTTFDPITPAILDFYKSRATKIAKDVNDETEKQLRAAISRGVADGVGTDGLRAVVEDVMGSASTMRADRIARTETTRTQSYADIQAWSQSGVVSGKQWYTAPDELTCPFCKDLDGTIIGVTDTFFNKGDEQTVEITQPDGSTKRITQKLSYDDVHGPPAHVQCRCTLLPIRAR